MLNLPAHTSKKIIEETFGGNSAQKITIKNYRTNAAKWDAIYSDNLEIEKNQIINE